MPHTRTHMPFSVFFPTDMGVLYWRGFAKPLYIRASLWGLHKTPAKLLYRGLSEAPLFRDFTMGALPKPLQSSSREGLREAPLIG